jgi:hypothetical protein
VEPGKAKTIVIAAATPGPRAAIAGASWRLAIWLGVSASITLCGCSRGSNDNATAPGGSGARTAAVAAPISAAPPASYPLTASSNRRYLVDRGGTPVLLLGDGSAQTLVQRLPNVVTTYLDDRQARGFNALWMHVIIDDKDGGNIKGVTDDNIAPFTGTIDGSNCGGGPCYDLTTPNPAYFARVDQIVNIAAAHGMAVFMDAMENNSYLRVYQTNGDARMTAYAHYLVDRYKPFANIVWMTGNDFQTWKSSPSDNRLALDLMSTFAANDPTHLQTTELNYNISGSLDDPLLVPHTSLAGVYTYYPTYYEVLQQYNSAARTAPVYVIESYYEGASYGQLRPHSVNDLMLRKIAYWTVLSGGLGGYFYGSVWYTFPANWQSRIDTPAVTHLGYWKALFTSVPWYNLVPDQSHTIVTAGYGTPSGNGNGNIQTDAYITAAGTLDGKLVMAYLPTTTTITVDMSKLGGPITAQWFDPTNGTYTPVSGSPFVNEGTHNFSSPGRNSEWCRDWVLILRAP